MKKILPFLLSVLLISNYNAQYCVSGGPGSTADSQVESVILNGDNINSVINYSGCPGTTGVEDQTTSTVYLTGGSTYTIDVDFGTCGFPYSGYGAVWIDYNQNTVFETSESIGTWSGNPPQLESFTFTVPLFALNGTTRIRVMQREGFATLPLDPCGNFTWGSVVDFSANISGAFSPSCPNPINLTASNLTASSADLSWTVGGTETSWNIEYGFSGFAQGTGVGTPLTVSTPNTTLTGLNAAFSYQYYVQAVCSSTSTSTWRGPFTFNTLCLNSVPPSLEDFDAGFSLCWSQDQTDDFNWTLGANGTTSFATGPSDDVTGGGNYMFIETSGPSIGDSALLYSENYDLSSLTIPQLTFYSHMYGATIGELSVWITDASGTATQVFVKNGDQGNQWNEEIVSLSNYSGVVQFTILGVVSEDVFGNTFLGDIAIDNFEISEEPVCIRPLASFFSFSNTFSDSADLSWIPAANESLWEIQWGVAGFPIGNGFSDTTSNYQNFTMTNLSASTDYDVYIRSICGVGDSSIWSLPSTFTTPCLALTPPQLENFSTGYLPTDCWSQAGNGDLSSGPSGFGTSDWVSDGFGNVGTTGAVSINLYSNTDKEWLFTPQYDFSTGGPYQVEVDFGVFNYFTPNTAPGTLGSDDRVELLISRDGGGSWTSIKTFNSNYVTSLGGNHEIVALPNDNGTVQFAFWGTDGNNDDTEDNDVMFDNFEITNMPPCPQVYNFQSNNITSSSADLSWIAVGSETDWNIQYGSPGFNVGSGTTVTSTSNSFNLTGLTSATSYDAYVQAVCSATDVSLWVGPINFSTPALCVAPTNLSDSNVTVNSAELYWIAGDNETAWELEYGIAGFSQGTGNGTIVSLTNDSLVLTGLSANTIYDYYVTAICGVGNLSFGTSSTFTTLPNPTCYYTVNMIDSYGDGWNGATIDVFVNGVFSTSLANTALAAANAIQTDSIFAYNGDSLSFSFASGSWDGEITFEIIDPTFNSLTAGLIPAPLTDGVFLIDSSSTSICQPPSCIEPANLSASNITSNSADLSWIALGTETQWKIQYGTTGFVPGNGTIVSVNSNPYSLTGLSSSIIYDFYVKAICPPTDSSDWTGPFTFNTLIQNPNGFSCSTGGSGIIYSEDFESGQGSWTGIVNSGFGWTLGSNSTPTISTGPSAAHSGNNYLYFESSAPFGSQLSNDSIVSPMIDLSIGSENVELSFWLHSFGSEIGTLKVGVSNSATGPFTTLFSYLDDIQPSTTNSFVNVGIDLSDYIGQQIFLEFDYTFLGWQYGDIAIDLIEISSCLACPSPSLLSSSNITGNSADLSWTANGTETTWDLEYGPAGFLQGSGTVISVATNPYLLTGLNSESDYSYYLRADCGTDSSFWAGPHTFSTPFVCPANAVCATYYTGDLPTDIDFGFGGISNCPGELEVVIPSGYVLDSIRTMFDMTAQNGAWISEQRHRLRVSSLQPAGPILAGLGGNIAGTESYDYTMSFPYGFNLAGTIDIQLHAGRTWGGLACNTTYNKVDSDSWTVVAYYGLPITCFRPTNLTASNLTTSSADVSWTLPNNSDTTFNIEYGPVGFTLGSGTSALVDGDTTYTLSGLNVSSLYEVYVQTLCGSDSSYWRGPTSFATACGTVSAPYFTNLDSGFPICWTQDSTDSFDWTLNANGTSSFPTGPSDDITGGGNYMYIETSFPVTTGDSALLHSVDIDLSSLTNPSLSFYSHMYGSSIGELSVWITSASGATNQVFVKNGNQGDQWNSEYVPLSGYTGVVQFTILAVASDDGAGNTFYGDIAIDNFEVSEAPSCPQVTNFGVFNISTNTAMTSWLPSSSNNSLWHVYLVPDTIPGTVIVPDSSHLIVSTNDTLSLTGLDSESDYFVYVRSICSSTDSSVLIGPISFSTFTNCPTPGALSLDNITNNSAEISWLPNYLNTSVNFEIEYGLAGFTTGNGVIDTITSTSITLSNLTTVTNYSFYVRSLCDTNNIVSGPLTFSTLQNCPEPSIGQISNITINSADFNWIAGGIENEWNVEYGPSGYPFGSGTLDTTFSTNYSLTNLTTSGGGTSYDLYLRAKCSVDGSAWTGPFTFTTLPTCTSPDSLSLSNINAFSVDLSWVAGASAQSYNIEYGPVGFPAGFGFPIASNTTSTTITGLNVSSSYDVYVQSNCGVGNSSSWIGPETFTTGVLCPGPDSLSVSNITISSADLSWIAGGSETSWNIEYGPFGFPQGTPNIPNVYSSVATSNTYTLTGLLDGVDYDFYVQAKCSGTDSSIWIGPLTFTTNPFCAQPTALSADSITTSSANLSWTLGGTETEWNVEYGITGFPQGTGFGVIVPFINNYDLIGLDDATSYDYYVQAVCGASDSSLFTGPYTFTTCPGGATFVEIISPDSVYIFNGTSLNTSGVYFDTLQSLQPNNTCDSIIKLNLTLNCSSESLTSQSICKGDSLKFGAFTYSVTGTYYDTLVSALGCDSIAQLDLTVTDLNISIDTTLQSNLSANVSGGLAPYNYVWSNNDSIAIIVPDTLGLIYLFVIDANGCVSDTVSYNVTYINTVGITANARDLINIYPNPSNGQFLISNSVVMKEIIITDLQGKNVYVNRNLNSNYLNIELDNLERGMYLVNIISENGIITKSVIIQ